MTFRPELLDELLQGYDNPEDLLGEGGILKQWLCCKNSVRTENPYFRSSDYAITPKMRLMKRTRSLTAFLGTPKTCPFRIMLIISYPLIVRLAVLNEPASHRWFD